MFATSRVLISHEYPIKSNLRNQQQSITAFLFLPLAFGLVHAKPFAAPTTRKALLELRGGDLGPIDGRTAAKVLTGIYVLQGSTGWVASESTLKPYGVDKVNRKHLMVSETMSANRK